MLFFTISKFLSSGALQQSTGMEREWVYYGSEWDKIKNLLYEWKCKEQLIIESR